MRSLLRALLVASIAVLILGVLLLGAGCTPKKEPTSTPITTPPATESTQTESAEPSTPPEVVLEGACTQCHSTTQIFLQPTYTDWKSVILRMEQAHGAKLTDAQKTAVAQFLSTRQRPLGEQVIAGKCTACHTLSRIYSKPSGTDWKPIIKRMKEAHGLALTPQEEAAVLDYLVW